MIFLMLNTPLSKILRTTSAHLKQLKEMGIFTVADLLMYFPRAYQDESEFRPVIEVSTEEVNIVKGVISNLNMKHVRSGMALIKALFSGVRGVVVGIFLFCAPVLL